MCTKPGALVLIDGLGVETFLSTAEEVTRAQPPIAMLNKGIRENYETSTKTLAQKAELLAESESPPKFRETKLLLDYSQPKQEASSPTPNYEPRHSARPP